jgi:hypothetical protein
MGTCVPACWWQAAPRLRGRPSAWGPPRPGCLRLPRRTAGRARAGGGAAAQAYSWLAILWRSELILSLRRAAIS